MSENTLSKWDIQLLKCIKSIPKTEKRIAKDLSLNILIVSQIITELIAKGLVQQAINNDRGLRAGGDIVFATTLEGLATLEEIEKSVTADIDLDKRKENSRSAVGVIIFLFFIFIIIAFVIM